MMNDYQKRLPSIGHGYASMPHSFKHGYGNPFRQQRLMAMRDKGCMYSLIIGIRERAENILFSAFFAEKNEKV